MFAYHISAGDDARLPGQRGDVYGDVAGIVAREFADDLPGAADVPALYDLEPPVQAPTDVVGRVTAEATGLPEDVPVVAGMLDVSATAVGSGTVAGGDTSAVVGTTLQIQRILDAPQVEPPPVGYTLDFGVDGRGLRAMGAMTGTPNLDWACETFTDDSPFAEIVVPAGEEFGALGSATMAGVAVGEYPDLDAAATRTLTVERSYDPRPEVTSIYDDWYDVYTDTCEGLVEPWRERAAFLA